MLPPLSSRLEHLSGSVFASLFARFQQLEGERFPLHVGDTWLTPPEGCAVQELDGAEVSGDNRYTRVPGLASLRQTIAQRVESRTGVEVSLDHVHVATGATGCLYAATGAMLSAGDEVLIMAPAWPIFAGMVRAHGGVPVWVPFFEQSLTPEEIDERLTAYRTDRTVAVYANTPNNPTGRCLSPEQAQALAQWCRKAEVWLIADEVYEDLAYAKPHVYLRGLAPERTLSVWSMSKGFGMAGYRVGYAVGPAPLIAAMQKLSTYTWYCAPHPAQRASERALGPAGDRWVAEAAEAYERVGKAAAELLGVPAPEGSTFLWVPLPQGAPALSQVLEDCLNVGVLVAPGTSFGPYERHLRVSFTSIEPAQTLRGVARLAEVLSGY